MPITDAPRRQSPEGTPLDTGILGRDVDEASRIALSGFWNEPCVIAATDT
jgi:hypothetical protein